MYAVTAHYAWFSSTFKMNTIAEVIDDYCCVRTLNRAKEIVIDWVE